MNKTTAIFGGMVLAVFMTLTTTTANAWWGGWGDRYYGPWGGGPWHGYPYGGYGYPYGGYGYPYGGYGYPYGGYGYPYGGYGNPYGGWWGHPTVAAPVVVQPQAPVTTTK
jgi:hypothetical protein